MIYPPLGAVADSLGGLVGARVLSLAFMLGATILLWGTAARLFGRRAAFFATALFAVLGATLRLGAFATTDAMSLFLVALAAWCVIRAGDREPATGWLVAAAASLALAVATAYTRLLFAPLIAALALLTAPQAGRGWLAARGAGTVLAAAAALLAVRLEAGRGSYLGGFERTMLTRAPGSASPLAVLGQSWSWAGLLLVLAVAGVVVSCASRRGAAQAWLLGFLSAALVAGPVEQSHLHTAAALNQHVGLGAWFAAIAAGYLADRLIGASSPGRARAVTGGACVIALIFPAALGITQSRSFPLAGRTRRALSPSSPRSPTTAPGPCSSKIRPWPSTTQAPAPDGSGGPAPATSPSPAGVSTGGPDPSASVTSAGNAPVYASYIAQGYFSLVALNYTDTTGLDRQITADLRRNHHYHIIQVVPYGIEMPPIGLGTYVIWLVPGHHQASGYSGPLSTGRRRAVPHLGLPARRPVPA